MELISQVGDNRFSLGARTNCNPHSSNNRLECFIASPTPDPRFLEARRGEVLCIPFASREVVMQTGIFGSRCDSVARRVGLLSAILLPWSAPPAKLLGQDVGSSSGCVFHIHGVVLNALTNKPVGRVLVTLMEIAALTDSDGRLRSMYGCQWAT
jgi:hypothetical protein